jgi:hypothetical protein
LQSFDEFVAKGGLEVLCEQFLCQGEEGGRMVFEVVDGKYGLRVWKLVFLQLAVESSAWASEIRDTCSDTETCASKDHYFFVFLLPETVNYLRKGHF